MIFVLGFGKGCFGFPKVRHLLTYDAPRSRRLEAFTRMLAAILSDDLSFLIAYAVFCSNKANIRELQ